MFYSNFQYFESCCQNRETSFEKGGDSKSVSSIGSDESDDQSGDDESDESESDESASSAYDESEK